MPRTTTHVSHLLFFALALALTALLAPAGQAQEAGGTYTNPVSKTFADTFADPAVITTSRDGERWVWGGAWTLPAGEEPWIGLISHGGDTPQATAEFDYFRVYR